jgi:D-glycero-D-manno-heptose 1,7-bisphosphate phosphatase
VGVDEALSRRAIFLDRDGVINESVVRDGKPYPPADLASLRVLPDVPSALAGLKSAGYALVVVTNQPDVGRGIQQRSVIDAMHERLRAELPLEAIYMCCHTDADQCACRKPRPGMLLDAARDLDLDLGRSFMVGDRWRDTDAGIAAGCRTIFIDRGYAERQPQSFDRRVSSLADAAAWILEH